MMNLKNTLAALAVAVLSAGAAAAPATADVVPAQLSAADRAHVAELERYLNNLTTMKSWFIQVSDQGTSEGTIMLDRPEHLRIEYAPPVPVLLVASDRLVMYYDTELKETTFVPSSETPAGFLLDDNIQLGGDLTITDFQRGAGTTRLTLVETDRPETGSVTLMFETSPTRLAKWSIVDAQGTKVEVALVNPAFGVEFRDKSELFSTVDPNFGMSNR